MSVIIHVAVGVIVGSDGTVLIAKRPDKVHQGGLWEFPGGKVEKGETVFNALKRELYEELAIEILSAEPLIKIRHDYGDKIVLLDVHKIAAFSGEAKGNEGQHIMWVAPKKLSDYQFPAANRPIISAINLPSRLLITGGFSDLMDFTRRLDRALKRGLTLVQLRVKDSGASSSCVEIASQLCEKYSASLLINTSPDNFMGMGAIAKTSGLYLSSKHLLSCDTRPVNSTVLLGASCHNQEEIHHAEKIGADFICVSPVSITSSHPGQTPMGWGSFERLISIAALPVFALGGMSEKDLPIAIEKGAQGIAAISEWWH